MTTNNPHIQLVFRAPANRGFVQGFAGIAESRPACSASGTVELRTSKPIKAAWIKITLVKVEKLPLQAAGGASYTSDVNGPFTLWEANGDWALLETRDIDFEIPIPVNVPPSTELHYDAGHGAGIWYRLEVTMLEKKKTKGILRKETNPLSKWRQNIDIMTHDCHPMWPAHRIPETLYLMTPTLQIHLSRPASAYGPGDTIQLPITLLLAPTSDRPQVQISLIQLSLIETSLFRSSEVESSYPKESFRLVGQRPALVSQSRLEVRGETLRGGDGGGRSWGLMLRIPPAGPGGIGYTVRGGKHLEVKYEIKVEIFGVGEELLGVVEKLPVLIDWMSTAESQDEVNKIGFVAALCPSSAPPALAVPDTKSLMSPSPPYPSPPVSQPNSYVSPPQSPPIAPYSITPSPPHSPVPYNAARQHQPMGMDRLLAIGTTPSSRASSEAGPDVATDHDFPSPGPGANGARRPSSQGGAASRPGSGESAKRPNTFGGTARPALSAASSSSSVPGQSQQNRMSFLVHNPSVSVRSSGGDANGSAADHPTVPLDLTARAPAYFSASPASALGAIQESMSPSSSVNTIGLGRPGAASASQPAQQYPSAEQEKSQMFARAQAAVGRTQSDSFAGSSTAVPSHASSNGTSRPSSSHSSVTGPPPTQKWETAEEEKRRLFEMANYKVAVTQALAAGLPPPPLPAALLVKSSQPPPQGSPSIPTQPPTSFQSPKIPASSTAPVLSTSPRPTYETATEEKARLFKEAQARVSHVQARSTSVSAQAGGSAPNGLANGSPGVSQAPFASAASSSSTSQAPSGSSSKPVGSGAPVYESAEAEKARLGAQRDKLAYDEAVARVARTQGGAGGSSSGQQGSASADDEDRARRADQLARATRAPPASRLSIHQPNGHRSVSSPVHRMSLSLHSPPPSASLSGHDSISRISSPVTHAPPTFYPSSISNAATSSMSSAPSSALPSPATHYPSADEEKARLRYQDAIAARDRVVSGGSSSSASRPPETAARVASPPPQPTIAEDPIPYDALYGPPPESTSSTGGAGPSASGSSSRPPAIPPVGAGAPVDEKEQLRRFYAAQQAVAARTSSSSTTTSPAPPQRTFSPSIPRSQTQPVILTPQEQSALFAQRELASTPTSSTASPPLSRDPTISMGKQRAPPSRPASSVGHDIGGFGGPSTSGGVGSAGVGEKAKGGAPPPLPPKPPSEYAARYVSLPASTTVPGGSSWGGGGGGGIGGSS